MHEWLEFWSPVTVDAVVIGVTVTVVDVTELYETQRRERELKQRQSTLRDIARRALDDDAVDDVFAVALAGLQRHLDAPLARIARIVTGWEGLLNFDPAYNIVNDDSIAEEVEAKAADNYVVRLKEGVLFADGKPVTADDVIYSFTRMLDPDSAVFGGAALRPILDPTGLVKVDDRTVEITLKQKVATFPEGLCAYT